MLCSMILLYHYLACSSPFQQCPAIGWFDWLKGCTVFHLKYCWTMILGSSVFNWLVLKVSMVRKLFSFRKTWYLLLGRCGSRILKWGVNFLHLNQRNQRNQILFQYLRDKKKKKGAQKKGGENSPPLDPRLLSNCQ